MTLACFQVASSCILPSIITAPLPSGMAARIFFGKENLFCLWAENLFGNVDLAGMQCPGADTALQKGVAELGFAGVAVAKVTKGAIEGFDPVAHAGVNHFGNGVVPEVLLMQCSRFALFFIR